MPIILSDELRDALTAYGELEDAVVSAGKRTDSARKLDLVQARRRFAEQLGRVSILIDQDNQLARTPEIQTEMSRYFQAFRYALGQHQANWPAVQIDENPAGYISSAKTAYGKSDLFWEWCRNNTDFRRNQSRN